MNNNIIPREQHPWRDDTAYARTPHEEALWQRATEKGQNFRTIDWVISDTHCMLPKEDFDRLSEYSATMPTGVWPGKVWKAEVGGVWYIRWYGIVPGDDRVCSNNQRIAVVSDALEIIGI
ncbi:hypothetical protein Axy10_024 [Achromobacter phage vB_AxyP_19-32_Axy10]|uniref:Uncharacterized protein n=1 Tax=Achromobacter phage vB_AxyP_19-32_Axy10 TaxID=2591041 RepID=A0A514CU13_9CAUD|nr:hypothetical protein KMC59_gp24 [Achromobacter phage vB_AxyP_19-32_Axy10]QDH83961.1 hypothetical protein Axy10_024 [Achromobacter phage vB_AxyP_19-32_Axy10]